mmetsp:Transcript_459/g.541  ORF Transcript_459/g.541 Transcript_459/m.541 type:complete len:143 (-) Transcript_459:415-843(-)|eukprot:CAMPEP_0175080792 /NCGR_PEP_ID=MMETSP0052_2-20121109/25744_1 /TAXON_ID=51329 ORGANISM="Polytomella parva, Strain SAG 63-3" /NCGR_SAMPLE_ID=MMETSP0052_2 /ASSEMBLY_ACC=CAM_ASM_000194 /LENGTH=142 /DNA_ID=CAMNT_0016351611 /DNA_START=1 /DNA_END=429 /DNA_ORIENTATION=+
MSMISSKLDAVSRNSIWEEHVKKENKTFKINENFAIADPTKMSIISEKPNKIIPTSNPDQKTMEEAKQTIFNIASLKYSDLLPVERFALPVTGNMEYGFFQTQKETPSMMFTHKLKSSEITLYANEYVLSNGTGPYNRKNLA